MRRSACKHFLPILFEGSDTQTASACTHPNTHTAWWHLKIQVGCQNSCCHLTWGFGLLSPSRQQAERKTNFLLFSVLCSSEKYFFTQNIVSDDRNYNLSYSNIDFNYSTKLLKGHALNMLLTSSSVDTFCHNSARYGFYFGQRMDILPVQTNGSHRPMGWPWGGQEPTLTVGWTRAPSWSSQYASDYYTKYSPGSAESTTSHKSSKKFYWKSQCLCWWLRINRFTSIMHQSTSEENVPYF